MPQNFAHNQTIRSNAVANVSGSGILTAIIGFSSSGTAATFYSYGGVDVQKAFDDLGSGPGPRQVAKHLIQSEGSPVLFYKATPSNAGTSTAVTQTGGGPVVTLTGAPNDQYDAIIKITLGGALGTSTFRYSLDGGETYSVDIATAATYLLPSGVTANMAAGTYVINTTYSWTDTAPSLSSSDIGTAMDAIIASPYDPLRVHVLGHAANAAGVATIFALAATKVVAAHAARKYLRMFIEASAEAASAVISGLAASQDNWVTVCGGFLELIDEQSSEIFKRPHARVIVPRRARNGLAVQPMRTKADDDLDPHPDVVRLVPDGAAASTGYHDEAATPGYTAAGICSLRTVIGRAGFYTAHEGPKCSATSDFIFGTYADIILQVARTWYQYGLSQLMRRVPRSRTTGFIDSNFAYSIEREGEAVIRAALGTNIAGVQVLIKTDTNTLLDPTVYSKVRVLVDGYMVTLDSEIALADTLPEAA